MVGWGWKRISRGNGRGGAGRGSVGVMVGVRNSRGVAREGPV